MSLTSKQRAYTQQSGAPSNPSSKSGKMDLNLTKSKPASVRLLTPAGDCVTLLQNTDENIHEVAEILEEGLVWILSKKIGRILILYEQSTRKSQDFKKSKEI